MYLRTGTKIEMCFNVQLSSPFFTIVSKVAKFLYLVVEEVEEFLVERIIVSKWKASHSVKSDQQSEEAKRTKSCINGREMQP